jgi:hypothetical protein
LNAPLGGRDVGTALEKRRRHTGRNGGDASFERRRSGKRERGRRHAGQHRDRVLELRALHAEIDGLHQSTLELRIRLHYVGARHYAGPVAVFGELERLAQRTGGVVEEPRLRVERAQLEIARRELRLEREACRGDVAGARSRRGLGGLDAPAHPAPQVDLPLRREPAAVARQGTASGRAAERAAGRMAAYRGGIRVQRRVKRGARDAERGERLAVLRLGTGERLVRDVDLLDQSVQLRVAEDLPPSSALDVVARLGLLPALRRFPECFHVGRVRSVVVGPEGAAGEDGEKNRRPGFHAGLRAARLLRTLRRRRTR